MAAWRWLHTLDVSSSKTSLAPTPLGRNLRSLIVGDSEFQSACCPKGLAEFVAGATRLESVYLACERFDTFEIFAASLDRLRELHVHCQDHYPTQILADNTAFTSLRTLAFHPHSFHSSANTVNDAGAYLTANNVRDIAYSPHLKRLEHLQLNCCNAGDEGIDLLVNSGLIHRLKSLDLQHGCVTDAGAFTLFKALDGKPHALDVLKLGDNALSGDGVAALRRLKLTLDAPDQNAPGDDHYLMQGDFE